MTEGIDDQALAKNVIFTGVAGTGKTYQLQQLAKQYTQILPPPNPKLLIQTLVESKTWWQVIGLIFLQMLAKNQKLLKVHEIAQHDFIQQYVLSHPITHGKLTNKIRSVLQSYQKDRHSQAYFDKDETQHWYLLPEALPYLQELQQQLDDYQFAQQQSNQQTIQRFCMVSFHQAYGYEEFVEGMRPINQNGQIHYQIQSGIFVKLCQQAANDPTHRYAMLIDEINRANVSRVFGELMSLIEPSKRLGQADAMQVELAYSNKRFGIPNNVDIYATMNTQDHSLTPLDIAFRRRFRFVECLPNPHILHKIHVQQQTIDLAKLMQSINQRICQTLGQDHQLGQAFFLHIHTLQQLAECLSQQIIPQIAQTCQPHLQILQTIFGQEFVQIHSINQTQNRFHLTNQYQFSIANDLIHFQGKFTKPNVYQGLYQAEN